MYVVLYPWNRVIQLLYPGSKVKRRQGSATSVLNGSDREVAPKTPQTRCRMVQGGKERELGIVKGAEANVAVGIGRKAVVEVAGDVGMFSDDAGEVAVWFAVAGNGTVAVVVAVAVEVVVAVKVAVKVAVEVAVMSQCSMGVAGMSRNVAGGSGSVAGLGETISDGTDAMEGCGTWMELRNAFLSEMLEVGRDVGLEMVGREMGDVGEALDAMGGSPGGVG